MTIIRVLYYIVYIYWDLIRDHSTQLCHKDVHMCLEPLYNVLVDQQFHLHGLTSFPKYYYILYYLF
jgi:hypothetical protein